MSDFQYIENTDLRKYRTEIPNIYDDMKLGLMEFRLLVHYIRVGRCYESVRTTAKKCVIGKSSVVRTRKKLEDLGLIKCEIVGKTYTITVVDIWMKNFEKYNLKSSKYGVPPQVQSVPPQVQSVPPQVHKKEPIKKEPIKNVYIEDIEEQRLLRINELIENVQIHHIWYYSTRRALGMEESKFDNLLNEWAELNSGESFNDKKHMCRSFKRYAQSNKIKRVNNVNNEQKTDTVIAGNFFKSKK